MLHSLFAPKGPKGRSRRKARVRKTIKNPADSRLPLITATTNLSTYHDRLYAALYPDLRTMTDDERHAHWLMFGQSENRIATPEDFLNLVNHDIYYYFDHKEYRNRHPDLKKAYAPEDREALILHYVSTGKSEGRFATFSPIKLVPIIPHWLESSCDSSDSSELTFITKQIVDPVEPIEPTVEHSSGHVAPVDPVEPIEPVEPTVEHSSGHVALVEPVEPTVEHSSGTVEHSSGPAVPIVERVVDPVVMADESSEAHSIQEIYASESDGDDDDEDVTDSYNTGSEIRGSEEEMDYSSESYSDSQSERELQLFEPTTERYHRFGDCLTKLRTELGALSNYVDSPYDTSIKHLIILRLHPSLIKVVESTPVTAKNPLSIGNPLGLMDEPFGLLICHEHLLQQLRQRIISANELLQTITFIDSRVLPADLTDLLSRTIHPFQHDNTIQKATVPIVCGALVGDGSQSQSESIAITGFDETTGNWTYIPMCKLLDYRYQRLRPATTSDDQHSLIYTLNLQAYTDANNSVMVSERPVMCQNPIWKDVIIAGSGIILETLAENTPTHVLIKTSELTEHDFDKISKYYSNVKSAISPVPDVLLVNVAQNDNAVIGALRRIGIMVMRIPGAKETVSTVLKELDSSCNIIRSVQLDQLDHESSPKI